MYGSGGSGFSIESTDSWLPNMSIYQPFKCLINVNGLTYLLLCDPKIYNVYKKEPKSLLN